MTLLTSALHLKYPLIVAPMAGGPSSVDLVVASSAAGALGSMGGAYSSPEAILTFSEQVRLKTQNPFAINLFIPAHLSKVSDEKLKLAISQNQKYRELLKIPNPILEPPYEENFDSQFEAVLKARPKVLSFIFGVLSKDYMKEAKKHGIYTIGTATSLEEALKLQDSEVDAIVTQGIEAGGHRGIFDSNEKDPLLSAFDLIKTIKPRVSIPLIAAGAIMNAADIKKMLQAGAEAVQMGTAFLATQEAGTSHVYKKSLLQSPTRNTKTTRAFSGRLARGIINKYMLEMDLHPEAILPFPAQNKFTRDLRNASLAAHSPDFLSLWSGTGEGDLWTGPAAELINKLF